MLRHRAKIRWLRISCDLTDQAHSWTTIEWKPLRSAGATEQSRTFTQESWNSPFFKQRNIPAWKRSCKLSLSSTHLNTLTPCTFYVQVFHEVCQQPLHSRCYHRSFPYPHIYSHSYMAEHQMIFDVFFLF